MIGYKLSVENINGEEICSASGEDFADLVVNRKYEEGDRIVIKASKHDIYVNLQVDDALEKSFVYLKSDADYVIPFNEKKASMSPRTFDGELHYIYIETAREDEIRSYRNLALNPCDQHRESGYYPHATANVETRGESVFAARNAIDGIRANLSHGEWPYGSWGINRQDDAELTLDFGRKIRTNKIVFYTRSDFPHDNWWVSATVTFSDGTKSRFDLTKTSKAQAFDIEEKEITYLKVSELIKADDPSPFPALTQIQVFGYNAE